MDSTAVLLSSLGPATSDEEEAAARKSKQVKRTAWHKLGLSEATCLAVKKYGFRQPTPIQRRAIPAILKNEGDVIAMARTGSGKTAAFLLPMIQRLDSHCQKVGARGLILSPSRELATQTGGMSMEKQFEHMANNPDILIATPGRLVHNMVETHYQLTRVEMVVFDEADQLFELGFEEELNKIVGSLKLATKQCILTSATLPSKLLAFARLNFINPTFVQLDADKQLSDKLTMDFYYCRASDKLAALLFWLSMVKNPQDRVMIFCATVHHVNFLAEFLASQRISNCMVAGKLDQQQRDDSLRDFKEGKVKVLLATDVAARGLDIEKLEYVFHYDFPGSAKLFVHRSGRTARKDEVGTVVSLVTKDDVPLLQELMVFLGRKFNTAAASPEKSKLASQKTEPRPGLEVSTELENNDLIIGGFPDLDEQREAVTSSLKGNATLERLHRSMMAGHACYITWRSREFSKLSLSRAGELLNAFGGATSLADFIHPKLQAFQRSLQSASTCNHNSSTSGLDEIFAVKEESETSKPLRTVVKVDYPVGLDIIRNFRPSLSKCASRGMGVTSDALNAITDTINNRKMVKALAREEVDKNGALPQLILSREDDSDSDEPSPVIATKPNISRNLRKRLRRGEAVASERAQKKNRSSSEVVPDFYLDVSKSEREEFRDTELNAFNQMERQTMDLVPDEDAGLKSMRHVMRWNSYKKKYEMTAINKAGTRIKTKNDSGTVVRGEVENRGLYKKWARHSERRIQRVGEDEDASNIVSLSTKPVERSKESAAVEPTPLENLTKDLGLLEKLKTHRKLTHKEQRKLRRLRAMAAAPVTETGRTSVVSRQEVKSLREMKSSEKRKTKLKAKHNKPFRKSQAAKSKDKHMAKRRAQALKRGAPTRSVIIRRHKR